MAEFEHDAFDDVPVDSAHRGAYRGETPEKSRGYRSLWITIAAGVLALLLGGILFVNAPRLSAPDTSSAAGAGTADSASATPTASATSSATATADSTTTVAVYNAGAAAGSAVTKATDLENAGWTVSETGNWAGTVPSSSTVYYRSGSEQQARAIAQAAGISQVQASDQYSVDVVVVLAADSSASPSA